MSAITFQEADAIHPAKSRMSPPSRFGDRAFGVAHLSMASAVVVLVILSGGSCGWIFTRHKKFGFHFLTRPRGTRSQNNSVRCRSFMEHWYLLRLR